MQQELENMASRHCARCGQPLDDAASKELGIGPICRGRDNRLLALDIPSDVPAAREEWLKGYHMLSVPEECKVTVEKVHEAVLNLEGKQGDDWRKTVKRIEWILSWSVSARSRATFERVVECLGYRSLVLMWRGESVKGKAKIRFSPKDGRLYIKGPRPPREVRNRMKAIPDWSFTGASKEWGFPFYALDEIRGQIVPSYIALEGLDEVEEAIAAYVPPAGTTRHTRNGKRPPRYRADFNEFGDLEIHTPYSAAFVRDLKEGIPDHCRSWDPDKKVWAILDPEWMPAAEAIAEKHFS
jgi:hypothetical protein